jgi:hypothetical protein
MPDPLPDLEFRRSEIVKQLARLGDLRSGSISNTSGRCGKPNCHCHQPGQPVHGPNVRLTYKEQGKSITESLPTPAAQKKAEREIAEFRRFRTTRSRVHRSQTPRYAALAQWSRDNRCPRKKNDGGRLRKSRPHTRASVPENLCRSAPHRSLGSGGCGDGDSFLGPSNRRRRYHRVVAI